MPAPGWLAGRADAVSPRCHSSVVYVRQARELDGRGGRPPRERDAVVAHAAGQGERWVMGVLQRLIIAFPSVVVKNSLPRWPRRRHA